MVSRYDVWLNDIALSEISPNLYVSDIGYQSVKLARQTNRIVSADGQYSGNKDYADVARVAVSFVIREYDTRRRQEIAQNVAKWAANGGWLKTSDRVSQKIYVRPAAFPAVSSVMRWTDALTVEFVAYDYPFWVDECPQSVALETDSAGTLYQPGVRYGYVEIEITAGAALSGIDVHCGDTELILDDLNVVSGDIIRVSYTEDHHILQIKQGNTSLLDKRAAESSDDLIANPGLNDISFTTSGNSDATCVFYARGVYV